MSNPTQTPQERASELAVLSELGLLEGPDASAMEHCDSCPFSQAALQSFGYSDTVAEITAALFPPTSPAPDLKDSILARIAEAERPAETKGFRLTSAQEGDWKVLPGGKVRLKTLSDDADSSHITVLLEADPGAIFYPHSHRGAEEVYLITGDLDTEEHQLKPGDHLRASPGTRHSKAISQNGCTALLITARENHPRKAISLYTSLAGIFSGKKDSSTASH